MKVSRRRLLGALSGAGFTGLSGCTALVSTTVDRDPPVVTDRPDAVYVPSHVEAYRTVDSAVVGDVRVDLAYTYPQRVWTVESRADGKWATSLRSPDDSDIYLVVTVRDAESGLSLPNLSLRAEIPRSRESSMELPSMLAQRLGPHYGANLTLSGEGTYRIVVRVDGTGVRRFGSFATRFEDPVETTFEFEYSQADRDDIPFTVFEKGRRGERDAVPPVVRDDSRVGRVPRPLPGRPVGEAKTGDARVLANTLESQRFTGRYLAVWLATPHNRFSLAAASLSAQLVASGATRFANALRPALDPELGFHYGAVVPAVGSDAELTVRVERPPQLMRHEGYETAFLEMPPVTL